MQRQLTTRNVVGVVLVVLGLLLLPVALGAFLGGNYAHGYVSSELRSQKIVFAADMSAEPEALRKFAGQTVDTGPEAKAYATMIKGHIAKATGGKTFSEISAAARKNPDDQTLQKARATALEGNTVYGSLQNAYGWWMIGSIGLWTSLGALVLGLLFLLIGAKMSRRRL